jgi:hypothetical protein
MYTKTYKLDLIYAHTDIYERLFDAAKFCYESRCKPKEIKVSEENFKLLVNHPAIRGGLGISKMFPPHAEILGFCFVVDLTINEQIKVDVHLLKGEVIMTNALVFEL